MTPEIFCNRWDDNTQQFPGEFYLFINEVEKLTPKLILEIGIAGGQTLTQWSCLVGDNGTVFGIDIKIQSFQRLRNMRIIQGSSLAGFIDIDLRAMLAGRKLDLLFVDGCHDIEAVNLDYLIFQKYVRPGGMIAFHDIDWGGPHKFFYGLNQKRHFVDTATVLPENVNALRRAKNNKDFAMSKTNTLGWIFKQ